MSFPKTVVVAALLLAGCESESPIAAAQVGRYCPASDADGEPASLLSDYLGLAEGASATAWDRVTRRSQLVRGDRSGSAPSFVEVRLDAEHLGGPARTAPLAMSARTADEAESELGRGSDVVLVSPPSTSTRVVAALRDDGSVAFLGECAEKAFGGLFGSSVARRAAAGDTRRPADVLLALATDRTLASALRAFEVPSPVSPSWASRPASQRVVDPDGPAPPPPDVMAGLRAHWFHFAFPEEWRSFEASLATFVPGVGWNAALPLSNPTADPATSGYASTTAAFEIWLVPPPADIAHPLVRVGVVEARDLAGRQDVHFEARVRATTLEDLVAQAKRGTAVFVVRD